LKNRLPKKYGAGGIPFAPVNGCSALHRMKTNGSRCLSQLSERVEAGLMDTWLGGVRTTCMKAGHKAQRRRYPCGLHEGPDSISAGMETSTM
jgi:hypothetical protein